MVSLCLLAPSALHAATNLISADDIPPLHPPRSELPLSFWDEYGPWPVIMGVVLLLLVAVGIWLLVRPKPSVPVPPAVEAHRALDPLLQRPEDGVLLSRISQVLRHYFASAFGLPPGELTTTEFCRVLSDAKQIGTDLSGSVGDFLRQCDERKFAPSPPDSPLGAVATASRFIDQAEARRAALAQAAARAEVETSQPARAS